MKAETTLFYDVDTQSDFIKPGGKYHVAGAEKIVATLQALTELAREQKIRIVCSVDCHAPGDPMLKSNGGPFPDHCIAGTPGETKIEQTAPLSPLMLENKEYTPDEIQQVLQHDGEIVFRRQQFDRLAHNAHMRTILRLLLQPFKDIVVYGVYVESCADQVIRGVIGLGPKLHLVKDAIANGDGNGSRFAGQWQSEGVELVTFDELKVLIYN